MDPFHDLVIILRHFIVASLILMLQNVVHALKSSSFQLIDLVVEDLQPRDADHRHVVRRVWDLDTDREDSNEYLRQFLARHEADVARVVLLFAREALENTKYHAHEGAQYFRLLEDAGHLRVLAGQLELVLSEHRVERQDVGVEVRHRLADRLVELLHAYLDGKLVDRLVHQTEH